MRRENHQLMTRRTELPRARRERLVFPTTTKITLWVLALALGLAAGCGTARPSKYYQLTVPGNIVPAVDSNPIPVTLLIGRLTGLTFYRADQIVYSAGGETMGMYAYERWWGASPWTSSFATSGQAPRCGRTFIRMTSPRTGKKLVRWLRPSTKMCS